MEGCTDGTWLQDGTRYFTCQPNRGYYCLLEHLIPDQRFLPDKESYNRKLELTIVLIPTHTLHALHTTRLV